MPQKTQRAMAKPENTFKALKRIFSYMYGFRVQFIFGCSKKTCLMTVGADEATTESETGKLPKILAV